MAEIETMEGTEDASNKTGIVAFPKTKGGTIEESLITGTTEEATTTETTTRGSRTVRIERTDPTEGVDSQGGNPGTNQMSSGMKNSLKTDAHHADLTMTDAVVPTIREETNPTIEIMIAIFQSKILNSRTMWMAQRSMT